MPISIERLSKIRGVSLRELRIRPRRGSDKLGDRFRRTRATEVSDEELFHEFHSVGRDGPGEGTADMLRYRLRARNRLFLPSLKQRRVIVEMMNRRSPA